MSETAVILAGGMGTRLGLKIPKPLAPIGGRPFLAWQLDHLRAQGLKRVILLLGHQAQKVINAFPDLEYSVEPEPLGTGGALAFALGKLPEEFYLLNGDSYLPMPMNLRLKTFSAVMTVMAQPGNVEAEGEYVTGYQKDASRLPYVDAGVYLMKKDVVAKGPRGKFDLGDLWPPLISARALGLMTTTEQFYDIGTPERLATFDKYLRNR